MKTLFLSLFVFLLVFSCKKDSCKYYSPPVVSSQEEGFYIGDSINLEVTTPDFHSYQFLWTGPNNFKEYGPIINFELESDSMAGEYSVKLIDSKGCESKETKFQLIVKDFVAPCDVDSNVILSSFLGNSDITYVQMSAINVSDNLSLLVGVNSYEIVIEFKDSGLPPNGIYKVSESFNSNALVTNEVKMYLHGGNFYGNLYANDGDVYVTTNNGVLNISFCEIHFTDVFDVDISANILKEW